MSFERMPGPMGAEPAPPAAAEGAGDPSPVSLQLQVLATEHWGLLATRSLAWNETFTRAGMFLSTLSGAIVALALVAQASSFGSGFSVFALVILPVVLFVGLATFIRMGASNAYDGLCVVGMNRIRHAYLKLTPEVAPYLVMRAHDDAASVGRSMGAPSGTNFVVEVIVSTPFIVAIINSVLAAAIAAILGLQLGFATSWAIAAGVVGFLLILALQMTVAGRTISSTIAALPPKFPAPVTE